MSTFFSPSCLLDHLFEYLPRLTDRFSENGIVSAEILAGDPQTLRVTDTGHGQSSGDKVVLIDGKIDTKITAVQDNGDGTLRFTTESEHDLTEVYTPEVELAGFTDSAFNGTFPLVAVPSRTLFEIEASSVPTLNGNEVLRENYEIGINGVFTITVVDVDTYDISLEGKPKFPPQTVPQLKRAKDFRLGIAANAKRAEASYTPSDDETKLWMYVIMEDSTASKDRHVLSDATFTNTNQNENRSLLINTFSLLVFFSTTGDQLGAKASDASWNEILKVAIASTAGIKFDDFGNTNYVTALIGHGSSVEKGAYYSHAYTFEYNYEVTQEEEFLTQFIESRAFRDNAIAFSEQEDGSNIDLDEEPT